MTTVAVRSTPARSRDDATDASYVPALDGLRGIAIAAVVVFHLNPEWLPGGYLGVSVFFTISGFVVTRSMLRRSGAAGRIGASDFYARRIRRLLPASALAIVATLLLTRRGELNAGPQEMAWTSAYLGNWYQLLHVNGYAELLRGQLAGPSPVAHYWSLAIEEQFYLLWPVAFAVMIRRGAGRAFAISTAVVLVGGAATVLAGSHLGAGAMYFASPFRFVEILVGSMLAFGVARFPTARRWLGWAGLPVLILVIALMVVTDDRPESWPYHGFLPLFALLSAVLIVSATTTGAFHRLMSQPALVAVGARSYGIYLYHWPIFLLVGGVVPKVGLTLVVAWISYRVIEQPFRRSSASVRRTLVAGALTTSALVGLSLLLPSAVQFDVPEADTQALAEVALEPVDEVPARPVTGVADAESVGAADLPATTQSPEANSESLAAAGDGVAVEPRRVVLFGDSTAVALGDGLARWAADTNAPLRMALVAHGACGVVRGGEYRDPLLNAGLHVYCNTLVDSTLPETLEATHPDTLVVYVTLSDTWDRSWSGDSDWLRATDDEFAERIHDDYRQLFETALSAGVEHIIWLRPPATFEPTEDGATEESFTDGSQEVVEATVRQLAAEYDGHIEIGDFRAWFEQSGYAADVNARPDGIHLSKDAARSVAEGWLGPLLTQPITSD